MTCTRARARDCSSLDSAGAKSRPRRPLAARLPAPRGLVPGASPPTSSSHQGEQFV